MPNNEHLSKGGPEKDPKRHSLLIAQLGLTRNDQAKTARIKGNLPDGTTSFHNHYEGWSLGELGRQHKERVTNNRRVVESLVTPGAKLQNADVLELNAAYYLGTYASWGCYEDGLPYPPIPEGEWLTPIRVTSLGIQAGAQPSSSLLAIPTAASLDDAIDQAREKGEWEAFHAGSRQVPVTSIQVLLSGQFIDKEKSPYWQELYAAEVAKNDQAGAALQDHLKIEYEFPKEELPPIE